MTTGANKALDRAKRMNDAEAWRPEVGDSITGQIVDIRKGSSDYGPYPLLILERGDKFEAVHAFHAGLKTRLKETGPKVLDQISIQYNGIVKLDENKTLHDYTVVIGDGTTPRDFNWDSV